VKDRDGEAVSGALSRQVAAAADLCRQPLVHAVVPKQAGAEECCLLLQARDATGERRPEEDLELEIYLSGGDRHLMLSWPQRPERPMLWQGQHPVWMDGDSGLRCERPDGGAELEALARRLRALLTPDR
jgi:hypothetical protein